MLLQVSLPSVAVFLGFIAFALLLIVAFAVAHSKRDVYINITLFEFHR